MQPAGPKSGLIKIGIGVGDHSGELRVLASSALFQILKQMHCIRLYSLVV